MIKPLLLVLAACTLAGCAEMANPPAPTPDQGQTFSAPCASEEAMTGTRLRKKTCG
jgi:hypothetical protein